MKKLLTSILICPLFLLTAADIYLPRNAPVYEQTAAAELSSSLEKIFGGKFPVTSVRPTAPAFYVGCSPEAVALADGITSEKLSPDEIFVRKAQGNIVVFGGGSRGTLYAVHELLERGYGVRYWTPEVSHFPRHDKFFFPEIFVRYAPVFTCREIHNESVMRNPSFAVKMRLNGHFENIPESLGGHIQTLGWCHTFRQLIPENKYFGKHPEFFSERDGKRIANAQPCLTNTAFRDELVKNTAVWLRRNPGIKQISISQNDNALYCECENCNKFVKGYGNQTDLLLDTVNYVAEKLAREFPDVTFETLSYLYTRNPPHSIRPAGNVAIRLCNIECNSVRRLDSEANKEFASDLKGWREVCHDLRVWNYITNFSKFHQPVPNWKCLAPDLRFFAGNHVTAVFEQASYGAGDVADLAPLRIWLTAKLLWNPFADPEKLTDEFLNGYYGKAGKYIRHYINLMNASLEKHSDAVVTCYTTSTEGWLDDKILLEAYQSMQSARKSVQDDPELLRRVNAAAFPVNIAVLERPRFFERGGPLSSINAKKMLEEQMAIAKANGAVKFAEKTSEGSYEHVSTLLLQQLGLTENDGVKPAVAGSSTWFSKAAAAGKIHQENTLAFRENDPASGIRESVRMPCTHPQWALQFQGLPAMKCDLYAEVRCEADSPSGNAVTVGLYSSSAHREIFIRQIPAAEISGKEYKLIRLGEVSTSPDLLLYFAPVVNRTVRNIWIKRFILIKKEQ